MSADLREAAVRAVADSMADKARAAWRSASAREGLADHEALVQHADAMSRWSERIYMALRGGLTGDEEWLTTRIYLGPRYEGQGAWNVVPEAGDGDA